MIPAAIAFIRKFWPIIWPVLAVATVLLSLHFWGNHREKQGVLAERESWQKARAELLELRRQRVDWSASRLAERLDAIPSIVTKETVRVETQWRDRPVRECFDADLVQSLEQARAAIRHSPAASPGGD